MAEGLSLGGGVGRVVRTASTLERYSDRFPSTKFQIAGEFMGDPAVKLEVAWQGDVNLEYVKGDLTLSAGGFLRRMDDYVTVVPDPDLPKRLPLSPPIVFHHPRHPFWGGIASRLSHPRRAGESRR